MCAMESRTIDVDGPVHVADWGGRGPTVVLLHGLGGSHLNWMAAAPRLARRHRVLAPDLPGFGHSPLAGRRATVTAYRAHVDRVIAALSDEPVILVGNSMGGLISMMEASLRPQRVAALVLVDAALPPPVRNRWDPLVLGAFSTYLVPGLGLQALRRIRARIGNDELIRRAMILITHDVGRITPEVYEAHRRLYVERSLTPDADRAFVSAARSVVVATMRRRRARRLIRGVVSPTLLIHGTRDRLVSVRTSKEVAVLRPDWDLQTLPRVGHVPMMEVPDLFCDVLEGWLERRGLSGAAASPALADLA